MAASEQHGICATGRYDPETWWPVSEAATLQVEEAVGLCHACPIRVTCLRGALDRRERDGIWGGFTASERRKYSYGYMMRRAESETVELVAWQSQTLALAGR